MGVAADRGEHVVEVVRHAAGEPSDALEPLGAPELALEIPTLGHVTQHGEVTAGKHVRLCGELGFTDLAVRANHGSHPRSRAVGHEHAPCPPAACGIARSIAGAGAEELAPRATEELARGGVHVDVAPLV